VRATPHGLRHAAGTTLAERTGDVFAVAAFLRHKDLATARAYVDNLDDKAGDAARIVAASVK
jgi:integrase